MPSIQFPPADPDDAPGAGYLAKYGPSRTDDVIFVSKSGVIHHGPSLQGVANAIARDAAEMRRERLAALVKSAAELPENLAALNAAKRERDLRIMAELASR